MGIFSKKPNTKKLLEQALIDYKNSNFEDCYQKVSEAADMSDARACFCKALLMYNDNVAPGSEPDFDTLEVLVKRAVDGGYALAYGFYAYLLYTADKTEELCKFVSAKSRVKDGVYLSYKASYYFGLYTEDENSDRNTTIATMKEAVSQLSLLNDELQSGKSIEAEEYARYNPYGKFSLNYTYSHANFLLMTAYYCENNWNDRKAFMNAFEETMKYMPNMEERFRAAKQYMRAILENQLGMSDFTEANRAMGILNECYDALDEDVRDAYADDYNELYDKYEEFYDSENENRRNRDITYSDGYADKNDISLASIASAITSGAAKWANSSSGETTTVYTIGNKKYTRGEMGYLYDEDGYKSDYRVDDYSRLYNENDKELGYFNTNGNFIDT